MVRGGISSHSLMRGREGMPLGSGYLMPPPSLFPHLGGRWMAPTSLYSRRDLQSKATPTVHVHPLDFSCSCSSIIVVMGDEGSTVSCFYQ